MELYRRAWFIDRPGKTLVDNHDEVRQIVSVPSGVSIKVVANRLRYGEDSYQYQAVMSPQEVLRCFRCLSPEQLREAMTQLRESCEAAEFVACVSGLIDNLTKAGMSALVPVQPAEHDDDDLFREVVPASPARGTCFDPFSEA